MKTAISAIQLPEAVSNSQFQKLQPLWKILYAATLISSVIICTFLKQNITHMESSYPVYANYSYILIIIPLVLIFHLLYTYLPKKSERIIYDILDPKKYSDPDSRLSKTKLMTKLLVDILYYFSTSFIAFYILRKHAYLPSILGGNNQRSEYSLGIFMCKDILLPTSINPLYLKQIEAFYIVQFSYCLYGFLRHTFVSTNYPKNKYYEQLFRHFILTSLLFFSYALSLWSFGVMALFCQDISAVLIQSIRFYKQTRYTKQFVMKVLGYPIIFGSCIFFRLLLSPSCCILDPLLLIKSLTVIGHYLLGLMIALFFLNIYWAYDIVISSFFINEHK